MPPEDAIEPVVEDGVVRNSRDAILGADNKAAVAAMLEATRRVLAENRPHAGIELLFTPKEEVGLLGAFAFDHTRLRAKVGYVYDQAAPIGDVILGAPSAQKLFVTFHGRAAHAGMYPEEGRSAIAAAAKAISEMRLGRIDEETTANVGLIEGGTAVNIVPERCKLVAEARSHDDRKLADLVQQMQDAITFAAGVADCEVETQLAARLPRVPLQARRHGGAARERSAHALRLRAALRPVGRRRRRERLQRARPPVREPRQRHGRDPHLRRAHRGRRPRRDGRGHARAGRRGPSRVASLVDAALLAILRCPFCRVALTEADERLDCPSCHRRFPIENGIPLMLHPDLPGAREKLVEMAGWVEKARAEGWYEPDDHVDAVLPYINRDLGWNDPEWHSNAHSFWVLFDRYVGEQRGLRVLELGAAKAWAAPYWAKQGCEYVATDILVDENIGLGRGAFYGEFGRVQADGERLPFADGAFDITYCCATLHHALDLRAMVGEMARVDEAREASSRR